MSDLQELLKQYRQEYDRVHPEIERLEGLLTQAKEALDDLEKQIKEEVVFEEQSVSGFGVKATFRSGYTRVSWKKDKLEGLALAFPAILECKKETEVRPSVSVKVTD